MTITSPKRHTERSIRLHAVAIFAISLSLIGGVGGWAATTSLSGAVIASGVVVVNDNVKKVQHLTGGIVRKLFVKEGDRVVAGQVLLRLDPTATRAELTIIESGLAQMYVRRARFRAQIDGRQTFDAPTEIAGLSLPQNADDLVSSERKLLASHISAQSGTRDQLESRKRQLVDEIIGLSVQLDAIEKIIALTKDEVKTTQGLFDKQLVYLQRLLAIKRQLAEQEGTRGQRISERAQATGKISEIDLQIRQLDQDAQKQANDDLGELQAKIADFEQRLIKIKDQMGRLDIVSPIDGRVYQLGVHTINGVVNPGDTLMLVVPENDELTIEARIRPADIDQVYLTQPARIRFSAFDQKVTPEVEGEVTTIAPDLMKDERTGTSFYSLRIRPNSDKLELLGDRRLYPGMPAEVFLRIGERTVLTYLTKPLTDRMNHVFREE